MVCRRVAGAVLLAAALLGAVGCTATVTGDGHADPAAAAVARDESQIRALVDQEAPALASFDAAKLAALTCAKNRDAVASMPPPEVPPMEDVATPEMVATPGFSDAMRASMSEKYPSASKDVIGALVDALVAQDEAAYESAFRALVMATTSVKVIEVKDIKIEGDTASASVTMQIQAGGQPADKNTTTDQFLKENGKWLDCTGHEG